VGNGYAGNVLALFWSPPNELSQDKRQLAETIKGYLPSISANPAFWILMAEHWVIKHIFMFFWPIRLHKDTQFQLAKQRSICPKLSLLHAVQFLSRIYKLVLRKNNLINLQSVERLWVLIISMKIKFLVLPGYLNSMWCSVLLTSQGGHIFTPLNLCVKTYRIYIHTIIYIICM